MLFSAEPKVLDLNYLYEEVRKGRPIEEGLVEGARNRVRAALASIVAVKAA